MIEPLYLTQYDLQPYYYPTAKDAAGNAIDLTGAMIRCTMKNPADGTLIINRQTTGITIDADQVNNRGHFQYAWQSGDTDIASTADDSGAYKAYKDYIPFYIEFEVTPSSGGKYTLPGPKDGPATVVILPGLDGV